MTEAQKIREAEECWEMGKGQEPTWKVHIYCGVAYIEADNETIGRMHLSKDAERVVREHNEHNDLLAVKEAAKAVTASGPLQSPACGDMARLRDAITKAEDPA